MAIFKKDDKAPDNISTLHIPCPICGPTGLGGVLLEDKRWLECNQCRLCIPDKPIIRKMLEFNG